MDPSILLRAQGITLPDPIQQATQAEALMALGDRRRARQLQIEQQARADQDAAALREALPGVIKAGFSDEAITAAPPSAQPALLKLQEAYRKNRADVAKTEAETSDKSTQTVERKLKLIGGNAFELSNNPNLTIDHVGQFVQQARGLGVDPASLGGMPQDASPEGLRAYMRRIANLSVGAADKIRFEGEAAARAETARHNQAGEANTVRGQDLTAATSRRGQDLSYGATVRGQDMTDARSRDANAIARGQNAGQRVIALRKEIESLPDEKNYRAALPILRSIQNAPDTPAGDLDFIYGVGKILDPGSVVREGEMVMVTNAQSPLAKLLGTMRWTTGNGRLTPEIRAQMIEALGRRVSELGNARNAALDPYRRQVAAEGLPEDQVFANLSQPQPSKAAAKADDGSMRRQAKPIKTTDDYNKLPPGTPYIDPKGVYRVKQ